MLYEKEIKKTLRKLHINGTYMGFNYLVYGIQIVINDPSLLTCICKGFYAEIAIYFNTTIACVERNIRTVKEIAWIKTDSVILKEIFNTTICPSNAEFIDSLSIYVTNELNNFN